MPLKVYCVLLFLAKGEDPYSTVQQEDIELLFLAFTEVTHLRRHRDEAILGGYTASSFSESFA